MVWDILLQVGLLLIAVFMFLAMHNIPQKLYTKFRFRNTSSIQAKRNFVQGAQILARARSAKSASAASLLAKQALEQAEKAISLDPKDAAYHILKALAFDLQGFRTSAIESLDIALSPLTAKSLSDGERSDALFKRAEVKMAISKRGRVDSAMADLTEALAMSRENGKALCLMGECYEVKEMIEEARKSYEEALRVNPKLSAAGAALERLAS